MNTAMRKILGDIAATPGRFAMMIIAIAFSSATLIAMLLAYQLLTRDMHRNYTDAPEQAIRHRALRRLVRHPRWIVGSTCLR